VPHKKATQGATEDIATLAQRMENHIGNNYAAYKSQVEGEPPAFLGCQGICTKCPHPEKDKYPTPEDQIAQCWASIAEDWHLMQGTGVLK
jgi:hypothetical protein